MLRAFSVDPPFIVPGALQHARVALVHDWLLTWRGGEKVLAAMAELFPAAPIFTLFHDPKDIRYSMSIVIGFAAPALFVLLSLARRPYRELRAREQH